MKVFIGFGRFNRYYWLIILSALFKLLINVSFKLDFQNHLEIKNISIVKDPILNDHIFIRFIYYYLGFIVFGYIYQKIMISKEINDINFNKELKKENGNENSYISEGLSSKTKSTLIHHNTIREISKKVLKPIVYTVIFYMICEILIFYIDQKNLGGVNFWVLEIFFIHFIFLKKQNIKLYKHQILAFTIIIFLSFGIKLFSSFTKQCEYIDRDPNNIDKDYNEFIKKIGPIITPKMEEIIKKVNNTLREAIINTNLKGNKACQNMYNIFIINNYFEYFIILSALGYLLGLFLHSFSTVKFKTFIDKNYVSPYTIILLLGLIGFSVNIILLIFTSLISCGSSQTSQLFCHSIKNIVSENGDYKTENYFDNFLAYVGRLNDDFHPYNISSSYNPNIKQPKDGIIEIIFSFLLSVFGFFKVKYDLFIIKELGVFHLLFPEVLYQIVKDIIIIIYKSCNNMVDKIQITQFIFIGLSNFFALLGICIYIELIELKFCGFDKDIKNNIIKRGLIDQEEAENEDDDKKITTRDSLLDDEEEDKNNYNEEVNCK